MAYGVAQALDEWLVRHERVLLRAPIQNDRVWKLGGELGEEAGFSDPGLARDEHEHRAVAHRTFPGATQPRQLGLN